MNNAAFPEFHNYKDIDRVKEPIISNGKIASPYITYMILDKSSPIVGKRRRLSQQSNIFLDGSFAQSDAQFQEFATNPLGTPKLVILDHLTKKLDHFRGYSLFFPPVPRYMTPIQAEQISMPTQERIRLDNVDSLMPVFCASCQQDKPETVAISQLRSFDLTPKDDQLLAKKDIFHQKVGSTAAQIRNCANS
jgi:hypothetical protein